jgi:hypothetical protein
MTARRVVHALAVRVIQAVKGDRLGDALVWQLGYVDSRRTRPRHRGAAAAAARRSRPARHHARQRRNARRRAGRACPGRFQDQRAAGHRRVPRRAALGATLGRQEPPTTTDLQTNSVQPQLCKRQANAAAISRGHGRTRQQRQPNERTGAAKDPTHYRHLLRSSSSSGACHSSWVCGFDQGHFSLDIRVRLASIAYASKPRLPVGPRRLRPPLMKTLPLYQ